MCRARQRVELFLTVGGVGNAFSSVLGGLPPRTCHCARHGRDTKEMKFQGYKDGVIVSRKLNLKSNSCVGILPVMNLHQLYVLELAFTSQSQVPYLLKGTIRHRKALSQGWWENQESFVHDVRALRHIKISLFAED